jgi:Flp pilus assembly protein TadG
MLARLKSLSRQILDHLHRAESGQSLIIIAFAFIALVAIVGLAIDLGIMYIERTRLGQAIDAAALAAAQELPNEIAAWDRAEEYLRINRYDLNDPDLTIVHSFPDEPVFDSHYQIAITGTKTVPLTFLRVLGFNEVNITTSAIGENANKLDIVLVLDKTGSMDDDTCKITRDPGGPNQYACNPLWLTDATTIFSETFDSGLGDWSHNSKATWESGYVKLEGGWSSGYIYRYFDTTGYDVVKVTFRATNIGMEGDDQLRLEYRIGGGGWVYPPVWEGLPTSSWEQHQEDLTTGAAGIPNLGIRFRVRNTESGEYALVDDVTVVGAHAGLGPGNVCTGGSSQDCGDDPDPFMNYFYEQPIYDTLVAADNFLEFLDSDLDQVGLASYSTSASVNIELTSDFNAVTNTLYTIDPSGCTNISSGIYAGVNGLSTAAPHKGRTNAVHIMILLSDGWSNTWAGSAQCACDSSPPCPYNTCYEGTSEPWGKVRQAYRWAKDNSIIIFTIGQSACVNEGLLREIAEETGGRYYWAPTTDQLDEIFAEIAKYIFLRLVR